MNTLEHEVLKGGEFLVKPTLYQTVFIPEDATEEDLMIRDMVVDFVDSEVIPNTKQIENQENNIAARLLEKAGELGILGVHMPEEFGGMNLSTNTNTLVAEKMGRSGSFTVTYAAHTGIGMLPIFYFGTDAQKQHYLPRLISGQLKACYCLTEPGSGSDALAAKTKAILSPDGKNYLLTGNKMWISNSGFADIFIVFAKVDGEKFTGFIVEKGSAGLTLGNEEEKMGIHGSSTRQVFFENTPVPVENVLGEIGKGHLIAFNVLNIGRFKLGALCLGGAKQNFRMAVRYANERQQFGVNIGSFGAIKHKLAEQSIRIFALESAQYRVSDMIQEKIDQNKAQGVDLSHSKLGAAEEFATECAILKILGSEYLDFVVDETVQIFGGNGFSEEFPAAKAYRDSRINRIYEGTNEINRLLMVDMLLRRAMKGHINLVDAAWAVQKELASMPVPSSNSGTYAKELDAIENFKKCVLMVAGAAVKAQMDAQIDLKNEQEVLMHVADMLTLTFASESIYLRVRKLSDTKKESEMTIYNHILRTYIQDANSMMSKHAIEALVGFTLGDVQDVLLRGVTRYTKFKPYNTKEMRREIADFMLAANDWAL